MEVQAEIPDIQRNRNNATAAQQEKVIEAIGIVGETSDDQKVEIEV